ncbi:MULTISPECIES: penicillin-binding transpeptidase domain-containing protein [Legionella]|uniref:Beta-lactamase n=1 Tax=Legionella septentrionalis TaxID=2498109 RepID=A0A3S0XG01_9GAMM|nr:MULTISPECIES: penicillin-binding transpeptidase domain-containing protein [Legionella]MCP0913326.1 penicillin-binding transpeptidase domain-containing protein [Legionella sp. 27cVA30]RUQ85175.1 class D beta-lactamase [Legionella septentrionalis]RUQ98003.1 class D beta-lactamase [Legionella septentrionalis]RUR09023.1 class D beta-lactamase [Legionella septentrionalis]RUR14683.1 class D beta-lactamase [Legionella septentrionalis]
MRKPIVSLLSILALNAAAKEITQEEYNKTFKGYNACFILYDVNKNKIISKYNPKNYCNQRVAPDSTFKIALSLMAFDSGASHESTVFKWNGKKSALLDWNHDQTPESWLKYSVVWVSQQLTQRMGDTRIKGYLAKFKYGNQDFSGDPGKNNGLQYAWLSSSLKISAMEQLNFLKAFYAGALPVSKEALHLTKKNMYQGQLENGADLYGKTGSGRHGASERASNPSLLRDGWFIGFVEKGSQQYLFISNLSDKTPPAPMDKAFGSAVLKPITVKLLNEYL